MPRSTEPPLPDGAGLAPAPADRRAAVEAIDVCHSFRRGQERVVVLDHATFTLPEGSVTALVGPTGAGKSTLLYLLAGLARPVAGELRVVGKNLQRLDARALARYRNRDIGIIFQSFNLLPGLTVRENVAFPLQFGPVGRRDGEERVRRLLAQVGLERAAQQRPVHLSGGEQQRVAIARALVTDPPVILADEPTGNLDAATAENIAALLFGLARESSKTLVLVTHHRELASRADRRLELDRGRIVSGEAGPCS